MPASYRKIDYSLRPAKHTERRMLIEIFRRLSAFESLDEYAYTGMGSVWFSDFTLVHRTLGIRYMTSMEWPRGPVERIADNVPFGVIKLIHQSTSQALPRLDWSRRQIVWLDYDGLVSPDVLLDCQSVATRARSGSILVVSLQCNRAEEIDRAKAGGGADAVTLFKDKFGAAAVGEIEEDDLYAWQFGETSRRLVLQSIQAGLAEANNGKSSADVINYTTICEIEYADDAMMTSVVVLFHSEAEKHVPGKCGFQSLDFISRPGDLVKIEIPNLTLREMRHLQRQLPVLDFDTVDIGYMPKKDAKRFAKLYRYLPNFAILEM